MKNTIFCLAVGALCLVGGFILAAIYYRSHTINLTRSDDTKYESLALAYLCSSITNQEGLRILDSCRDQALKDGEFNTVLYFNKDHCELCIQAALLSIIQLKKTDKCAILCDSTIYRYLQTTFSKSSMKQCHFYYLDDNQIQRLDQFFNKPVFFVKMLHSEFYYGIDPANEGEVRRIISLI